MQAKNDPLRTVMTFGRHATDLPDHNAWG